MEKYKELFYYSKEVFAEELTRFSRIDEKASKFFAILTLLLGVFGYFVLWFFDNFTLQTSMWKWGLLLLNVTLLSISLLLSWWYNLKTLGLHNYEKLPLDSETIDFFSDNREIDIYFALSKQMAISLERNVRATNSKANNLKKNYQFLFISIVLLLFLAVQFSFYKYNNPKTNQESLIMGTDETKKDTSSADEKPNPNVKPPKFRVVTEGFVPSKDEITNISDFVEIEKQSESDSSKEE